MAAANVVYWLTPAETVPVPEKTKIDWDCPCLGKIRESPCFPSFRATIECMDEDPDHGDTGKCTSQLNALDACLQEHPREAKEIKGFK